MASSATVGLLKVLLTANSAEFEAAMKRAAGTAQTMSKDMKSVGTQMQSVGLAFTKATLPLVGLAAASAKAAIDFESSFAGVRKTVTATEPEFKKLADGFRGLAKTIPINVNELNKIGEAAGQLGIKTENILGFTEVMAKLGVTTNLSSDQAATSLARLANITQMPQTEFGRLGSTIVALGNKFATTESEIVDFGLRIAGAGKIAGLSEHQILAIGAAMSSVGVEAEAGGTAVQKVLNGMTAAVATGGKELEQFAKTAGMSAAQFQAAFKEDAAGAFSAFVGGLKTEGDQAFATLDKLGLGNERVIRAFLSLANAGDLLNNTLKEGEQAWRENTALTNEANERFKTTASQLILLWNRVQDLGIVIGNALLPAIRGTVDLMGALLPIAEMLAKGFAAMPGPLQMLVVGLAGAVAAAGPLLWVFGSLTRAASDVIGAFGKKGIATRLLAAEYSTLTGSAGKAATAIGLLGKTAAAGAAFFVGWQIGRLISELLGLDEAIARVLRHESAMKGARAQTAEGGQAGRAAVTDQLAQKERDLAQAIRDGNRALASRLQGEVEAIKGDQTRMAILDTINKAIADGASQEITYAQAIAFNAKKVQERAEAMRVQLAEQQATNRATETATEKTNRLKEAQEQIAAANAKYKQELTGIKDALVLQIKNMEDTGKSTKDLAAQYKISEDTVSRLKREIEGSTKAQKEAVKAATEAEKAAEKHAKAIEKQLDALEKLGVVTENQVLGALGEFNELVMLATKAGVPLDNVLAALAPKLDALQQKAKASGIEIKQFGTLTDKASDALIRLNQNAIQKIIQGLPAVRNGLEGLPPVIGQITKVSSAAEIQAGNLTESFKFFGIKTRAELEATARAAIAHFESIRDSGTAMPADITKAYEAMVAAMIAAGMKVEKAFDWGRKLRDVSNIMRSVGDIFGGVAGSILGHAADIVDGITAIITATDTWGKVMAGIQLGLMLLKKAIGLFKDEAHEATNDIRDDFFKLFGSTGTGIGSGFQNLARQLHALGLDGLFKKILNARTPEAFAAAVAQVEAALDGARAEMKRLASEGGLASRQMIAFMNATRDSAETIEFLAAETKTAADSFGGFLASANFSSQASASAGADMVAAAYAQMRAEGMTARQALAALGPTIQLVDKKLAEAGFTGSEAFSDIARLAGIAAGELSGPVLDGINHLTRGLEAAHNAGFLTQSMFAGITAEIIHQRQVLIDQGHTAEDVNRLMQRDLQTLWQLRKDYNYEVDETTGLLLDEAEAAGLVGDRYRSAMDRAAIAMEKAANAIVRAFGLVGDEAEKTGGRIDSAFRPRTVHVGYDVDDMPAIGGGTVPSHAATGGTVTRRGVVPSFMAVGGGVNWTPRGTDTVPAMLTPGEVVLNEGHQANIGSTLNAAMRAASALFHAPAMAMGAMLPSGGGHPMMLQPIILQAERREIGRVTVPIIPGEARRLGVRVRS